MLLDALLCLSTADNEGPSPSGPSAGNLPQSGVKGLLGAALQLMWDMGNCLEEVATGPRHGGGGVHQWDDCEADGCRRDFPGLPSRMDVPTKAQEAARAIAVRVLGDIRQVASRVWPSDHPAAFSAAEAADGSSSGYAAAYADWEVLQAETLSPLLPVESAPPPPTSEGALEQPNPPPSSEGVQLPTASSSSASCWLWCFSPACTNLSGPSELALQTSACGGGCGVRYCSPECQAQGWRDGHRLSCARLRTRRQGPHCLNSDV